MIRLLSFLCLLAVRGLACRCVAPSIESAYGSASAVVIARVVSISTYDPPISNVIRVEVLNAWKRPVSGTINIYTGTDCAYPVKVGEEYLLFLAPDGAHKYSTALCMGNLDKAAAENAMTCLGKHGRKLQ